MSEHNERMLEARVEELERKNVDLQDSLDEAKDDIQAMEESFSTILRETRKWV